MVTVKSNAPIEEQQICVKCGYCCDGTLFLYACLNPGERGHLPEKIEQNWYSEGDKEYFRLPCQYFLGKCSIYDKKRAYVCSSFRCQLLKDFSAGKATLSDSLEIVREAGLMRAELVNEYRRISGSTAEINFRQLLTELWEIQKSASEEEPVSAEYEMLIARCNILEALLIRYFGSAEDFEKMIMK